VIVMAGARTGDPRVRYPASPVAARHGASVDEETFDPSEAYGGYLPPAGTSLPASDRSGTLRLTRRGELITAYYLAGRDWIPIVSGTGPTEDVPFSLAVFNLSNVATFAAQPVTVSFDNFRVVADAVTCP